MTVSFPEFRPAAAGAATHVPVGVAHRTLPAPASQGLYRVFLKRLFDVTAVLVAAPFVAIVIGVLAVLVCLDGGPAFYSQLRVGRHGRTFRMRKLRSMVPDADRQMAAFLAANDAARDEWAQTQKLRDDPRVTRLGRLLRRSSLDELPQVWNVLMGEMSLVGPRPIMPAQEPLYPGSSYYLLRPGITGHWQTAGRNRTSFAARADYDDAYEAEMSLAGDLRILWRTIAVVLRGTGC